MKEILKLLSELEQEMKVVGAWDQPSFTGHPQMQKISYWLQHDFLPRARDLAKDGDIEALDFLSAKLPWDKEFEENPNHQVVLRLYKKIADAADTMTRPILAAREKDVNNITYHWEIPVEEVNRAFDEKFKELQQSVKLPGYARGAIPTQIIREKFEARVQGELTPTMVQAAVEKALQHHGHRSGEVYGHPTFDLNGPKYGHPFSIDIQVSLRRKR